MLNNLDNYDWQEVFKYCYKDYISPVLGWHGNTDGFSRDDVKNIIAMVDGENDGQNWIGLFELKDGRFAFVSAGCDYTGWGCQEGGHTIVGPNEEMMIQFALGQEDRDRIRDEMIKNIIE